MNCTTASRNARITVITVTRHRSELLKRAIQSVKQQTCPGVVHYIVIDDCPETLQMLEQNYAEDPCVYWKYYPRDCASISGPSRLSFLRNSSIREIPTKYFSFLDDDNEFYPEHLEKLLDFAIGEGCNAVHSYREILYHDGRPYLEQLSPWGHSVAQRREKYHELLETGVAVPGSNIWRDKFGVTVDTNVWLLKTDMMCQLEIPMEYSVEDYENVVPEDAKMMNAMLKNGIRVLTNQQPTVKYYLGGYSNSCGTTQGTEKWEY